MSIALYCIFTLRPLCELIREMDTHKKWPSTAPAVVGPVILIGLGHRTEPDKICLITLIVLNSSRSFNPLINSLCVPTLHSRVFYGVPTIKSIVKYGLCVPNQLYSTESPPFIQLYSYP
jgi:hypothetical protein